MTPEVYTEIQEWGKKRSPGQQPIVVEAAVTTLTAGWEIPTDSL